MFKFLVEAAVLSTSPPNCRSRALLTSGSMGRLCRTAHLELMPVGKPAMFHIQVDTTDNAGLAVSVQGTEHGLSREGCWQCKERFHC